MDSHSTPRLTIKFMLGLALFTFFLFFFLVIPQNQKAHAQSVPSFGCEMRPGYRVCSSGGCTSAPAVCYPRDLVNACPDDPANGKCYAVENQQTCQAHPDISGTEVDECARAGPFQCVEVPCDTSPAPTFNCEWLSVDGTPRCIADIRPNVCPDDEENGICYVNDNMQCSPFNRMQCLSDAPKPCVQVSCNPSSQPRVTTTPTPSTSVSPSPSTTPPTSTIPPSHSNPPRTNPPDYNAPDYPEDDSKEHIYTPGERAIPDPYVPCSSTRNNEFHSLRPYQASPCYYELSDVAMMCANKLTLEADYQFAPSDCNCSCSDCQCSDGGAAVGCRCQCNCSATFTKSAYVDVFDAELPIMGNTEDKLINSQDQPDPEGIDNYAKVNEYVSWYLSGITTRAEYGKPVNDYLKNQDIADFSGPIKKLLAWDSLATERNEQIERAGKSGSPEFDEGGRHNQIVACQSLPGVASACYTQLGLKLRVKDFSKAPIRSDYASDLLYNIAYTLWKLNPKNKLFQFIPLTSTEDRYGELRGTGEVTVTGGNVTNASVSVDPAELFYPHLEESRENADLLQRTYVSRELMDTPGVEGASTQSSSGEVLQAQSYYATCHFERGSCVITNPCPAGWELVDPNFCNDLSGLSCQQRDLYGECRRSSPPGGTTPCPDSHPVCSDLSESSCSNASGLLWSQGCPLGNNQVGHCCLWQDPDVTCGGYCQPGCGSPGNYTCDSPNTLVRMADPMWGGTGYACCSPEDPQCSQCGSSISNPPAEINTQKTKHVIPPNPPQCDLTRVRTNPGDTINPTELKVTATFTVSTSCEVPGVGQCVCEEDPETGEEDCTCSCSPAGAVCPGGTATVTVDLTNYMPLAEENFNRLVASPYSPLQRIFPKIESGAPIQGIFDMPAYSLVNYASEGGLQLTSVQNPGGFPLPPKLFYPHIGSIHQYFLNCIQTALRPEGYGPYCPKGYQNTEDYIAGRYPTPTGTVPPGGYPPTVTPPPGSTPSPGDPNVHQISGPIADQYNVEQCILEAVMDIESGFGQITGSRRFGQWDCCNDLGACGPAQINYRYYDMLDQGDGLNLCSLEDSFVLLARYLVAIKRWAVGDFDSVRYEPGLEDQYPVGMDDIPYVGAYHTNEFNCIPTSETQARWGQGASYCYAISYYCQWGNLPPDPSP